MYVARCCVICGMTEMELEAIKLQVLTQKLDERKEAYEKLKSLNNPDVLEDVFQQLLRHLKYDNEQVWPRNEAAYMLRYIADERALEPLFEAAMKKENINYNGSIVYSLEVFDCREHFNDLFELLLVHGFEARLSAFYILDEQVFYFTHADLNAIKTLWEEMLANPDKYPQMNHEWSRGMMQHQVESYLHYLNEPDDNAGE